jgi:hypothetical protein
MTESKANTPLISSDSIVPMQEISLTLPKVDTQTEVQQQKVVSTKKTREKQCLSCRNHCKFEILEIVPAKNSKTEICKGKCPNLRTILENKDDSTSEKVVVCGANVCSIQQKL